MDSDATSAVEDGEHAQWPQGVAAPYPATRTPRASDSDFKRSGFAALERRIDERVGLVEARL